MPDAPATVAQAARELRLSTRQVQADVAAGCDGIVRPGAPGRGRGALLDLAAYREWRARRAGAGELDVDQERERAFALFVEAAFRVFQDHGGVTRQNRGRSAALLVRLLDRVYPALTGRDLCEPPEEMRTLLRVFVESTEFQGRSR